MGSVRPLNGKPCACTSTITPLGAYDGFYAPTTPVFDDDSLALLIDLVFGSVTTESELL